MKLYAVQLALALLVIVTYSSANVFDFSFAANHAANHNIAVAEATERLESGVLIPISRWNGDTVLYNNIVLKFNQEGTKIAPLALVGDYNLYAMDWTSHREEPKERLFLFAMHHNNGHFAPLGFARYHFLDHAPTETFWRVAEKRTSKEVSPYQLEGFPPPFFEPRRAM